MNIIDHVKAKLRGQLAAHAPIEPRDDGLSFYQAIDLPGIGSVPGMWDHRGTEDVYLAYTDFSRLTALDVGPANGFWSFEMERRGASVTALELGPDDDWDAVPLGGTPPACLPGTLKSSVEAVHRDFLMCRAAKHSQVKLIRGTAYATPTLVEKTDVALMGNILQHLRDPFLALERVAAAVTKRMIVSESIWIDDEEFLQSPRLQLIPRSDISTVNHSWFQTTPVFVMEVLKILGLEKQRCWRHEQRFTGTPVDPKPRMVPHFTVLAER